jgi:hypothetical protein
MHYLEKFISLMCCSYMFRCTYVHHLQGACSLLSYFKILFKLMCVKVFKKSLQCI